MARHFGISSTHVKRIGSKIPFIMQDGTKEKIFSKSNLKTGPAKEGKLSAKDQKILELHERLLATIDALDSCRLELEKVKDSKK